MPATNSLGSGFREKFRNHHGTQVFDYNLVTILQVNLTSYEANREMAGLSNRGSVQPRRQSKGFLRFPFVVPFFDFDKFYLIKDPIK